MMPHAALAHVMVVAAAMTRWRQRQNFVETRDDACWAKPEDGGSTAAAATAHQDDQDIAGHDEAKHVAAGNIQHGSELPGWEKVQHGAADDDPDWEETVLLHDGD